MNEINYLSLDDCVEIVDEQDNGDVPDDDKVVEVQKRTYFL
jgi:hypothetical protein